MLLQLAELLGQGVVLFKVREHVPDARKRRANVTTGTARTSRAGRVSWVLTLTRCSTNSTGAGEGSLTDRGSGARRWGSV